jgi:hypothetical protein
MIETGIKEIEEPNSFNILTNFFNLGLYKFTFAEKFVFMTDDHKVS